MGLSSGPRWNVVALVGTPITGPTTPSVVRLSKMSVSRLSLRAKEATAADVPDTVPPTMVEACGKELVLPAMVCCLRNVEDLPVLGKVLGAKPFVTEVFFFIQLLSRLRLAQATICWRCLSGIWL